MKYIFENEAALETYYIITKKLGVNMKPQGFEDEIYLSGDFLTTCLLEIYAHNKRKYPLAILYHNKKKGCDYMPLPDEHIYTSDDYWNLPDGQRAELIDGQLYNMTPPNRIHQKLVMEISASIRQYIKANTGSCDVYPAPFAVNLTTNDKTWVEPDISVICDKDKLSDRGCEGAPDWIIEIVSPANTRTDYIIKLFKYRTAGVREYWIVNPMKNVVQTYIFEGEETANLYSFDDEIPVHIFKDMTIKIADLLS